MPELPEVTTTTKGLQKVLPGRKILDVWSDLPKKNFSRKDFEHTIKNEKFFKKFKKSIIGKKVISAERRGKNILIHLSGNQTILIHMKMTGHLLFGEYTKKQIKNEGLRITKWEPKDKNGPLADPFNRFVHLVFTLSGKKHLAFSDSRKFGKVTLIDTSTHKESIHLKHLGPEPLDKNFDFKKFKSALSYTKANNHRPIKQVLLDQSTIAGIGNIYSDEMLWLSNIHPKSKLENIPDKVLKKLFSAMKDVLQKGIDFGGDSMSDYRDIHGNRGNFQNHHNVYRKNKEKCGKRGCAGDIMREVIAGRSTHFCPKHQKLY